MSVIAKFRLHKCEEVRSSVYVGSGQDGKSVYEVEPGARIEMGAVQSEPFGRATPYGKIEANIFNPAAAAFFANLWRQYVRTTDPNINPPEYYVVFMTPQEYEAHFHDGTDVSRAEREARV